MEPCGQVYKEWRAGLEAGIGRAALVQPFLTTDTDLAQSISCSRVGQQWLEDSLAFGMDNRDKQTNKNNKPKSQGLKEEGGTCGQETDREHVCGQRETESERLEFTRQKQPQSHSENRGWVRYKTQPPTVENHRQGSLEKHTDGLRGGR